jgi:hypothetical protein
MRILQRILLIAFFLFPLLCRAEENCLWMNAATAGGILGGAATVTVSHPKPHPPNQTANATSSAGPMSANPSADRYASNSVDDADCAFDRQPSIAGELRIQVRTINEPAKAFVSYTARCGARGVPLKAIGNEAMTCDINKKTRHLAEQVVGRVRDRLFVIDLTMDDPSITQGVLREKARTVAEIVAGNLF